MLQGKLFDERQGTSWFLAHEGCKILLLAVILTVLQVIVNGYQGATYPTTQSERNNVFRPLVTSTVQLVLKRDVEFSVHGRNGEVRNQTLPPVEIKFSGGAEVAETFRRDGSKMSRDKKPGAAHLYFNACTTLATRYSVIETSLNYSRSSILSLFQGQN